MSISASFTKSKKPDSTIRKLEAIAKSRAKAESIMKGWGGRVQNSMQTYPAQVGDYRRTGTYGRGFRHTVKNSGSEITVTVTNAVRYAQFVGGAFQRDYHKAHGWQQVDEVASEEWEITLDKLEQLYKGK